MSIGQSNLCVFFSLNPVIFLGLERIIGFIYTEVLKGSKVVPNVKACAESKNPILTKFYEAVFFRKSV